MRPGTADRLAEVERELRTLGGGIEPRQTAKRILQLLNERDRLLGVWTRTCLVCGDSFPTSRAHAQYCGDRCRQRARRQPVTDRVTDSSEIPPVCGVPASRGQSGGSTTATATAGQGTAV